MSNKDYKFTYQHRSGIRTLATACLMLCCMAASAGNTSKDDESAPAYIDSVNSWGTWELGLEPAAGPQMPNNHAVPVRLSNVQFRPNDNAAFIPNREKVKPHTPLPNNPPAPIPSNPTPPVPTPVFGPGGSGDIVPGLTPNPPNAR